MAGWASTPAGTVLRAFEDTNTSRQKDFGARQDPLSSRAALVILPRAWWRRPRPGSGPGALMPAAFAAAFVAFLKSRTFCSDSASTTSATER